MVGFGNILPTYTDTYAVWCGGLCIVYCYGKSLEKQ